LTRKQQDDRYDLNQLPKQDERRMIKMSWSIVSKAADRGNEGAETSGVHDEELLIFASCILTPMRKKISYGGIQCKKICSHPERNSI